MGRAIFMSPERYPIPRDYCSIGRSGQDRLSHKPQGVHDLHARHLELSFQRGGSFSNNEVLEYLSASRRENRSVIVAVPPKWTMGGGPRTYPGGMKKWQWKRSQRKDERELEKERVTRERKIFETRRRQELRETSPPVSRTSDDGQDFENVKGGWTGSTEEVATQIQKVRDMVSNKRSRRAGTSENETISSFSKLPLSPSTLKALTSILDIQNMTPLQEATFPIMLRGSNRFQSPSIGAAVQKLCANFLEVSNACPLSYTVVLPNQYVSITKPLNFLPFHLCSSGDDLLARTKVAGEGTITSLIYAIESVLKRRRDLPLTGIARMQQNLTVSGRSPVIAVVVCPTQESASFLVSDAKILLMFHPGIRVQVVKGGNDIRMETRRLQNFPCEIVIATPGRLLNHLQSSPEFRGQLSDLRLLVLMEVQKLLDMGYRRTIDRISQMLPRSRQTLLWSSSHSDEVLALAENILNKNHPVISSCGAEEDRGSHQLVRHDIFEMSMESHLATIVSIINAHVEKELNYKVVVFCQTVRTTTFMSEFFKKLGFFTCELHMRKDEKQRERAAAVFRTMTDGVILFTCGASVWGVANPDVTLVLQIGQPAGREQYSRRVSLSGQETKERECILLLMPHERAFLEELSTVPFWELDLPEVNSGTEAKVQLAVQQVDSLVRVKAYLAWLRYHVARATSVPDKHLAVKLAGIYCTVLGFERPPQLSSQTIKTLGLKGIMDVTDVPHEEGKG